MEHLEDISSAKPLTHPLISTKIGIPPLRAGMVLRPRLLDRLSGGKELPLLVVSGTAGSGKTSLVCQWIARDNLKAAWYSMDQTDNDDSIFFRYLLAALASPDNRASSLIAPDVRDGRAFSEEGIVSRIVEHVGSLQSHIYLVLDDYHFVTSRHVHRALADLLKRMPPNMHIVLITRYSVPFSLSAYRIRGRVVEVSASEMRFTPAEVEALFEDILPLKLTSEETREVAEHMEGWVGGLQLLSLSLSGKSVPDELGDVLGRCKRKLWDYLVDEVINDQSPKVRAFLEATSPLERFNVEIARELTGLPDAGEVLDHIYRNNLFLIPLDGGKTWWRYHLLLSEAVVQRMNASSPEKLPKLFQRAALWFARNDYLEDAFRNAFASRDFEFAADLLEDHLLFITDRYGYGSGKRWIAKLPDRLFADRALLRLLDCGEKVASFRLQDIEAVILDLERDQDRAFQRYSGHKRRLCEDLFAYYSSALYYYYRDPAHPVLERLEQTYGMLAPKSDLSAGYTKILVAWSNISLASPLQAEAALNDAAPLIMASGGIWARTMWYRLSATVQRMQGRLGRSETLLREAFEFLELKEASKTPVRHLLNLPTAWVHYYRNEIEEASRYAEGAVSFGEEAGFARDIAEGRLILSLAHKARGEVGEAEDCLERVRRVGEVSRVCEASVRADPWLIRLSMVGGDTRSAVEWSRQKRFSLSGPFSSHLIDDVMTYVELLLRQKDYLKAQRILMKMRHLCVERNMMEIVLDIDIVRSTVLFAGKRFGQARRVMEKALSFAEQEGYVRPFLNHDHLVLPVLRELPRSRMESRRSSFLKRVIAAYSTTNRSPAETGRPENDKKTELTGRELDVLRLMAAGYRNKEIALEMFVSLETVKTHVKHILEKLDADSRAKAVSRARDLRLAID